MTMTRDQVIAQFPPKPLKEDYSQGEWEERMGRWNSTVGRNIALALTANGLSLSPDPAPNIDASLATSEKNEGAPAEQIPIKQIEMNSQEYHDHFRTKLEMFIQSENERYKDKAGPKTQK